MANEWQCPWCHSRISHAGDSPYLPAGVVLRLRQIIGSPKANPPVHGLIPVSRSTWYEIVKQEKLVTVKLGPRASGWHAEDVLRVARKLGVTVEDGRVVVGRRSAKKELTFVTMKEWDEMVARSISEHEPTSSGEFPFADLIERALAELARVKDQR